MNEYNVKISWKSIRNIYNIIRYIISSFKATFINYISYISDQWCGGGYVPGKAKRKYESVLIRFAKRLKRPLEIVVETLKPGYTKNDLLEFF